MRRFLSLTTLALLAAGGCGDDDGGPGRTATATPGYAIAVVADEYSFDPETIILEGSGELVVELENEGVLAHNLRVFRGDDDLGGTAAFTGGKTRDATVSVEAGEYRLVCTVGNHAELGMTGKLMVE